MNEYEIATLASRNLGHWIAIAQVFATLIIGAGQIAVVWYGIRAMQRAGADRAKEHEDRHVETMRVHENRHVETMRALEALIERTAPARAGQ